MRLLVVIVNYRTAKLTVDCLALAGRRNHKARDGGRGHRQPFRRRFHLPNQRGHHRKSVDDMGIASAPGSQRRIRLRQQRRHPPGAQIGRSTYYVLLLNPDTIVLPGALKSLLDFMDEHPLVGIAGSRLEHPDGTPQRSAFRFHSVLSEWEAGLRLGLVSRLLNKRVVAPPVPQVTCPTDWVAGASMIVRRAVFERIGLLDEGYFMYFEEVDFCLRARRAGWPCWYVPASRSDPSRRPKLRRHRQKTIEQTPPGILV